MFVNPHDQNSCERLSWKPCIFSIVQKSLSLRTTILCISGVPMNDLPPMKNCPDGGARYVKLAPGNIKFISRSYLKVLSNYKPDVDIGESN